MASVLIGVVWEVGDGFIQLSAGSQIRVPLHAWQQRLVVGVRVSIRARLLGAEWVADDIVIEEPPRLVRRPLIEMDTLRSVIRAKLADGRLSRDAFPRVLGRPGNERLCPACDQPATKSQVMIEGPRKGSPTMRFHLKCFRIWGHERRIS